MAGKHKHGQTTVIQLLAESWVWGKLLLKSKTKNVMKVSCPRCQNEDARIHAVFGVLIGSSCLAEDEQKRRATKAPEFYSQTMQTRVQQQRDEHEKDMMPPYDYNGKPSEDFRRAYPEKAKDLFSEYERITGKTTELTK